MTMTGMASQSSKGTALTRIRTSILMRMSCGAMASTTTAMGLSTLAPQMWMATATRPQQVTVMTETLTCILAPKSSGGAPSKKGITFTV